ncbi:MAG TPA: OsmC family protein [Candidatus Acidoferrum sp.]|nr:OsmC family protein [Candidatus Acidoferrum sp.]
MAEYKTIIKWHRTSPDFLRGKYSREHTWIFDGGMTILASSSPHVVPVPWSNPTHVDPEEAFVASISSCHMLTFLYLAGKQGFQVESYEDEAVGSMTKNEKGVPWMSSVSLNPKIIYGGEKIPTSAEAEHLHHLAHEQCYIAQSVKTEITVQSK